MLDPKYSRQGVSGLLEPFLECIQNVMLTEDTSNSPMWTYYRDQDINKIRKIEISDLDPLRAAIEGIPAYECVHANQVSKLHLSS